MNIPCGSLVVGGGGDGDGDGGMGNVHKTRLSEEN